MKSVDSTWDCGKDGVILASVSTGSFEQTYGKVRHGLARALNKPFDGFVVRGECAKIRLQIGLLDGNGDQLGVSGDRFAELRLVQNRHTKVELVGADIL